MKDKRLRITIAVLLSIILLACDKNNYAVDPPTYMRIDSFLISNSCFVKTPNRPDIFSHKITDAWVYVDDNLQGVYELPATFPIIIEGSHDIEIRPGIKQNGISSTRAIYPFYEFYQITTSLNADEVISFQPCIAYRVHGSLKGEVKTPWTEDFEGIVDLTYNDNSDVEVMSISNDADVFQGHFSGGIFLSENQNFFELISPTITSLPTSGTPIYLELNYRTNHEFFVGLYTYSREAQENLYGFRANTSWTKVYIDLTDRVRYNANSPNFNIFIGFFKEEEADSVEMFIDNIKLLHF